MRRELQTVLPAIYRTYHLTWPLIADMTRSERLALLEDLPAALALRTGST